MSITYHTSEHNTWSRGSVQQTFHLKRSSFFLSFTTDGKNSMPIFHTQLHQMQTTILAPRKRGHTSWKLSSGIIPRFFGVGAWDGVRYRYRVPPCESNKTYQWWWVVRTVVRLTPSLFTAETTYNNITEINSKVNNSLTSHTLHREEGSGHTAADEL